VKKNLNRLRFDRIIVTSLWLPFLAHPHDSVENIGNKSARRNEIVSCGKGANVARGLDSKLRVKSNQTLLQLERLDL